MNTTNSLSRRGFLATATTVAAGIGLAGGLNIARSAHAAGGDELKIALIGCGGRGTGAVVNCLSSVPNVKLWAMADAFADRLATSLATLKKERFEASWDYQASAGFGNRIDVAPERCFVGFDAYQKALATNPDVVLLCTPPGFRPNPLRRCWSRRESMFFWKSRAVSMPLAFVR